MKWLAAVLMSLVMVSALTACGKQPVAEIDAAESAVAAAVDVNSEVYAAEDFQKLNTAMNTAMEEVKSQDGKIFKNYEMAGKMLANVKVQAVEVKTKAAAAHERLKQQATADLATARAAVAEAKTLLENAPAGKGSAADIMAMKADAAGLETAAGEIQPLVDAADYVEASSRSLAIVDKAGEISAEIRAATARMAELASKAKNKPKTKKKQS